MLDSKEEIRFSSERAAAAFLLSFFLFSSTVHTVALTRTYIYSRGIWRGERKKERKRERERGLNLWGKASGRVDPLVSLGKIHSTEGFLLPFLDDYGFTI